MSKHLCPNCGVPVHGIYCSKCGQKYKDHKPSFGELVYEFFSDFTHFDSRFFHSVVPLLFKPGVVTIRYNEGKHASQLHPIRLYIFTSFVYFLLVFSGSHIEPELKMNTRPAVVQQNDSTEKKGGVPRSITLGAGSAKIRIGDRTDSTGSV